MEALYAPRTISTSGPRGLRAALGRLGRVRRYAKERQTGASTSCTCEPLSLLSGGRSTAGGNGECELPFFLGAGESGDWHRQGPLQCQKSRQKRLGKHCVNGIWTDRALHWRPARLCAA